VSDNVFETANSVFAQALYEDYLRDPMSVPEEWRELFRTGVEGEAPNTPNAAAEEQGAGGPGKAQTAPRPQATTAAPPPAGARPSPRDTEAASPTGTMPITGPALRLLQNMEDSLSVPTATSYRELDVATLWDRRKEANDQLAAKDLKLSFTHLIGWAIVLAAKEYPSMVKAVVDVDGKPHRYDPGQINLGLAVDVQRKDGSRGLLVPVIKAADAMTFRQFHEEYERLVNGARDGKLMPDAYQGATITLTNPGTIGTAASVPRLMSGQGSIIATGTIRSLAGARIMTVSSTYDHRIIQGAESGFFLQTIDKLLQGERNFYEGIATELGISLSGAGSPAPEAAPANTTDKPQGVPVQFAEKSVAPERLYHVAAAMSLVKAHRTHGFLAAQLDPLGTQPVGDPALDPEPLGLTREVMEQLPTDVLRVYVPGKNLAEALPHLRDTYCGSIAYEIEHIDNHQQRVWLRHFIESGQHRASSTPDGRKHILETLIQVDGLETFLHRNYLGHKRFGIEGLDMLVPMLHTALDIAADHGTEQVVIGMAHRGRLSVLANILDVSNETLLAEFEGGAEVEETLAPRGGTGDVKYHHGREGVYVTPGGKSIDVKLMPNPSHLEAVDPVVEGYARAAQTNHDTGNHEPLKCMPVLIHGDAAFAGQGVVAETLNLGELAGYATGGTLHIIANNQVGFTTTPREARSTDFASDLAKGFDIPIIHVNADDPDACIAAIRLAMRYRAEYGSDCVIDLVGYRRHGHNEGDEPRYTQPLMYQRVDAHQRVREIYAKKLIQDGIITEGDVDVALESLTSKLLETQKRLKERVADGDRGREPVRTSQFEAIVEPTTAVAASYLKVLNEDLLSAPNGFTVNPKLKRQLDRRANAFSEKPDIDWAHAEALALGTLIKEGYPVRLTGQDTARGTFSQRHLALHDAETGEMYAPIQHLPDAKAHFELHNSPLSEYAALGFEYGYSVRAPKALVLWEAQFGDFANSAEIIIDQFIVAGLAKWGQTSRLVLLLPHGYEGQGPEHSSARIERFLAIAAEYNIRVANCSTPAQYFHLLRRQALHRERRPLVIMTPKSLLRMPQAASSIKDLTDGAFYAVLDDTGLPGTRDDITRLVMCSGKVYYDVVMDPRRAEAKHVAVSRVEMLYPFPSADIQELLRRYPNLKEVVWVQEEPSNFGPRKFLVPQILSLADRNVHIESVSRPERSSPAEGYPAAHKEEQNRIVSEALR